MSEHKQAGLDSPERLVIKASEIRGDFSLNIDLEIPLDGVTALFGKSGAGKTSLLRLIAGLDEVDGASVQMGTDVWQSPEAGSVPAHQRQIGYIFQTPVLFEHLSVQGNLDYAFRRASKSCTVDLSQLGVDGLLERRVASLSGGERQRVALARALASNPRMLLMDEPVSALDRAAKDQIIHLIQDLHRTTGIPIIYVSHSLDEVARVSDRLLLMRKGRVIAEGTTTEMLTHPEVTSESDVLEAIVETQVVELDTEYGLCRLQFAGGHLWVANPDLAAGDRPRARIMARDLSLTLERQEHTSIQNVLPVKVVKIRRPVDSSMNQSQVVIELDAGGCPLLALITRRSVDQLGLHAGQQVFAQIKSVALLS